ncbi:type II toxin-antitoxin system RelE/ParE family toxin [Mucilaginibacter gotjawali]|uniref:Uncharacterized protein n=2 Tax=Mucilaginibacter gotjawali TaxID=1550579 RepID=A0A839SJH4_9SPHI|nr:type II toxin-antitoxin system RelE/ParE family toxin [Mucilaginibacter gotjawali]MBB3057424.1 hypothetical protein [Mucilaginibacter gotjawali]BAU55456.1 Plasmid stabilization system protein [Mucilaginibacter gotjawali]
MSFVIKFYRKAYREYFEAYKWYEERQPGLGDRFENSVKKLIDAIDKHPLIFANKAYDTREGKTEDFPYLVVYKIYPKKNVIYITSIFHTSRNPKKKYRK